MSQVDKSHETSNRSSHVIKTGIFICVYLLSSFGPPPLNAKNQDALCNFVWLIPQRVKLKRMGVEMSIVIISNNSPFCERTSLWGLLARMLGEMVVYPIWFRQLKIKESHFRKTAIYVRTNVSRRVCSYFSWPSKRQNLDHLNRVWSSI